MPEANPQRLAKLRDALAQKDCDGILISHPENRHYLSGFTGSDGYLLISNTTALLATDFRYFEQVKREASSFTLFPLKEYGPKWLPDAASQLGLRRIGFEPAHLSFSTYRQFVGTISEGQASIALVPQAGLVEALRAVKDAEEISLISRAAELTRQALRHLADVLRPGMSEKAAAWLVESFLREDGSESAPFEIIVASGPNSALPHARPSDRVISAGEPIVVDLGARMSGYCSDVTRTLCLGEAGATYRRVYDVVYGAQRAAIELMRAGMTGGQADALGRTIIAESGYADCFGHGLGHGIGLGVHEAPRLGTLSEDVLSEGMVFTVEPGVYLPDWGGVRIEDTVVMESSGVRVLS